MVKTAQTGVPGTRDSKQGTVACERVTSPAVLLLERLDSRAPEPTVFTQDQADFQGVKVEHPFQAYKNDVFLFPNELDEKVPKLHFLALKFRTSCSQAAGVHELECATTPRFAKQDRLQKQRRRSRKRRRRKDSRPDSKVLKDETHGGP